MDQARGSPSDPGELNQKVRKSILFSDTASEDDVALYHPPESSEDLSEMSLDTRPETPPLPEENEPEEPTTKDSSDWKSEPVEPESADIDIPAAKPTSKSDVSLHDQSRIIPFIETRATHSSTLSD